MGLVHVFGTVTQGTSESLTLKEGESLDVSCGVPEWIYELACVARKMCMTLVVAAIAALVTGPR